MKYNEAATQRILAAKTEGQLWSIRDQIEQDYRDNKIGEQLRNDLKDGAKDKINGFNNQARPSLPTQPIRLGSL